MSKFFTIIAILNIQTVWSQDVEKNIESEITEVTIFLSGAQVTRAAELPARSGTTSWVISHVSPKINEQSIQVEVDPQVKLLAVSFRVNYLDTVKKSNEIFRLQQETVRLERLIAEEKDKEMVFIEEEAMLKSNKQIGGQQGVNVNDLKVAVDYFRNRMTDIKQKQQAASTRAKELGESLEMVRRQLVELKAIRPQPTGEVVIRTSARNTLRSKLKISYLVQEARWYPSYDVRAKDVDSPIGITYKANVSQQSGEDWEKVKLTISSANPTASGAKPNLAPWFLGFNNSLAARSSDPFIQPGLNPNEVRGRVVSAEDGSPLPGVNIVIKGTTVGTVTDVNGEYSLPLTADAKTMVFSFIGLQTQEVSIANRNLIDVGLAQDVAQLSEVVVTGYATSAIYGSRTGNAVQRVKRSIVATPVVRQTNVEYVIDEPYTIGSDGESRTVEMIEYEVEASYQYYCVPKLDLDAFLIAHLVNWEEYNLLEGEASLFFEGKFVGKTILDTRNTMDTLSISLGRDKNVTITREKLKDFSSRQLLGGNRKVQFAYEIQVRNKKHQDIAIRIQDQIPLSNTKEINIDKTEDSDAEYVFETGLLKWNKLIPPGRTEKIVFRYAVKYPKYSNIILE